MDKLFIYSDNIEELAATHTSEMISLAEGKKALDNLEDILAVV